MNTTVYMRDTKKSPVGVLVFQNTDDTLNDLPVVAMGWSKANKKHDIFIKKFGREVAFKRCLRSEAWFNGTEDVLDMTPSEIGSDHFVENTSQLPFIIKDKLKEHLDIAKANLRLEGSVVFVIPVIQDVVDFADFIKTIDLPNHRPNRHRVTRYLKVLY